MQSHIQEFIDNLYMSSIKEMLKRIRKGESHQENDSETNQSLLKAEEALKVWKYHMDDYLDQKLGLGRKGKGDSSGNSKPPQKIKVINPQQIKQKEVASSQQKVLPKLVSRSQQTQLEQNQTKKQVKEKQQKEIVTREEEEWESAQESGSQEDDGDNKDKMRSIVTLAQTAANTSTIQNLNNTSKGSLFDFAPKSLFASTQPITSQTMPLNNKKEQTKYVNPFEKKLDSFSGIFFPKSVGNSFDLSISKVEEQDCSGYPESALNQSLQSPFKPNTTSSLFQSPPQSQGSLFPMNPSPFGGLFKPEAPGNPFALLPNPATPDFSKKKPEEKVVYNPALNLNVPSSPPLNNDLEQKVPQEDDTESVFVSVCQDSEEEQDEIDPILFFYQNIGSFLSKQLNPQMQQYYSEMINTYYPSNYFHVGPRYAMFDLLGKLGNKIEQRQFIECELEEGTVALGANIVNYMTLDKITNLRQIRSSYYSSNYFHVGPRRTMLGYLENIIKITAQNI